MMAGPAEPAALSLWQDTRISRRCYSTPHTTAWMGHPWGPAAEGRGEKANPPTACEALECVAEERNFDRQRDGGVARTGL